MGIRITQNMLNRTMLSNLNKSYREMDRYQDQLSSEKRINKPSDDPAGASRAMFYRSTVVEIDQYKRNANDGLSWIEVTDEALDQVTSALKRVRELTVQANNGTYEDTSLKAIVSEINQIKEHIGEIANTTIGDRYIFAGTETKTKPYRSENEGDPPKFMNENMDKIEREVGQDSFIKVNVAGKDIFPRILDALEGISKALNDGTTLEGKLDALDNQLDNVLKERAIVGANMNRMEMMISRLENVEMTAKKLLSETEDVDVALVITNLMAQENVHRAALSAGSRIIQPTLVDFLR